MRRIDILGVPWFVVILIAFNILLGLPTDLIFIRDELPAALIYFTVRAFFLIIAERSILTLVFVFLRVTIALTAL